MNSAATLMTLHTTEGSFLRKLSRDSKNATSAATARANEVIGNIRTLTMDSATLLMASPPHTPMK
jgi:hypothetical protein